MPDVGELFVGAYLRECEGCDVVSYNVRPRGGGMRGLDEFDVIGLKFENTTAYLCEVATHLEGLLYGSGNADSIARVKKKLEAQRRHAETELKFFTTRQYSLWAPIVPTGRLFDELSSIDGLELVANGKYKTRVEDLRTRAKGSVAETGNSFFRTLQLLERLRD